MMYGLGSGHAQTGIAVRAELQIKAGRVSNKSVVERPDTPAIAGERKVVANRGALLTHRPMPFWKRAFDVVGAFSLLVVFWPVLVGIAVFIRCVSRGSAIFTQQRLGEMGEYFTIYKFRTLHQSDETTADHRAYVAGLNSDNEILAKPDVSDRVILGGEFLRSHSLDELPQLVNVLIGNMSLVGPRPDVLDWEDYPTWQQKRFEATPGMTGLWQVSGKNRLSYTEMVELDLHYIQNRSLWLDLRILLKTVLIVFIDDNG